MNVPPFVMPPPSIFDPKKTFLVTDLDGCLVNSLEMIQTYIWDQHHIWIDAEKITQFDVVECLYPLLQDFYDSQQELKDFLWFGLWNSGIWYLNARPNYTYWQALLHWYDNSEVEMEFLSARSPRLLDSTLGWINRWGFDILPNQLTLTDSSQAKADYLIEIAQEHEQVVFIDDRVSTILDVARMGLGSHVKLLLFAQPWNSSGSPDWQDFTVEGMDALDHPEFDIYLNHGFDFGFRRLDEAQISSEIVTGLGFMRETRSHPGI